MTCNAPGPDGLRCKDRDPCHPGPHWHSFGSGAWVTWYGAPGHLVFANVGAVGAVFDMLRDLGAALAAVGAAWRAA